MLYGISGQVVLPRMAWRDDNPPSALFSIFKAATMPMSKREQARIERRLIETLTEACETAKSEIVGFVWLTHEVDYNAFPKSLKVIWMFDTRVNKERALASGEDRRMIELTGLALDAAQVEALDLKGRVVFDSER
jgi:hypothetical protein